MHVWAITVLICWPGHVCERRINSAYYLSRPACEYILQRMPAKYSPRCERMSQQAALKLAEGPILYNNGKRRRRGPLL